MGPKRALLLLAIVLVTVSNARGASYLGCFNLADWKPVAMSSSQATVPACEAFCASKQMPLIIMVGMAIA